MVRFLREMTIFVRGNKNLVRVNTRYPFHNIRLLYDGRAMSTRIRGHPRDVTMLFRRLYDHIRCCTSVWGVRAFYVIQKILKQFKIPVDTRTHPRQYHDYGTRYVIFQSHYVGLLGDMARCPSRIYS